LKSRYVAIAAVKPRSWLDGEGYEGSPVSIDVYAADPEPKPTGLLDARGIPLFRISTREPIGFRGRSRNG
jgi:hypothetical protein